MASAWAAEERAILDHPEAEAPERLADEIVALRHERSRGSPHPPVTLA
jgi:hypothetical protein